MKQQQSKDQLQYLSPAAEMWRGGELLGSTIQMKADEPCKLNNNLMCYPAVVSNPILFQIVDRTIDNEIVFHSIEVLMHIRFDHFVPYTT